MDNFVENRNCSVFLYFNEDGRSNFTINDSNNCPANSASDGIPGVRGPPSPSTLDYVIVVFFGLICSIGLLGNGLVIFVIARYTKMKTVTNVFILNLSIADGLFLMGLPMAMTTSLLKYWFFGEILCKTYYILTCINQFTGAFTLTVMSGDRFLAVCYPLASMDFRTPKYAFVALAIIWGTSLTFMIPVMLYSKLLVVSEQHASCFLDWPAAHAQIGQKIFMIYTLLLGFAIPVFVITVLYTLLILRLQRSTSTLGMTKKRSHTTKVTKLVTIIVSVFIICWLPYWAFQSYLIHTIPRTAPLHPYQIYLFQAFTILSYANSMVNPILYAFTNENFREAFRTAFACGDNQAFSNSRRRSTEYVSLMANPVKRFRSHTGKKDSDQTKKFDLSKVANTNDEKIRKSNAAEDHKCGDNKIPNYIDIVQDSGNNSQNVAL